MISGDWRNKLPGPSRNSILRCTGGKINPQFGELGGGGKIVARRGEWLGPCFAEARHKRVNYEVHERGTCERQGKGEHPGHPTSPLDKLGATKDRRSQPPTPAAGEVNVGTFRRARQRQKVGGHRRSKAPQKVEQETGEQWTARGKARANARDILLRPSTSSELRRTGGADPRHPPRAR